ncbi:MAG: porin family protein [Hyphomonadaceae bacterium]|nr:porin family protein [Hyphomonadaceae bacterium]
MKSIGMILSLGALAVAAPAHAQTGAYVNGGYTHYETEDVTLGGVGGRLGYRFHPNFAVEGEAAFGVKDDDIGPVTVELDHQVGVYGVGILPVTPQLDLFGRVGWAKVEASASVPGLSVDGEEDGVAFGGGAQYMLTDKVGIRGDYTRLEGDDDGADTFSASAVVKF